GRSVPPVPAGIPCLAFYALLAAFSTCRTRAGLIGALRMRTPVASKKAFAIAAPTLVVGGSPDPPTNTPLAVRDLLVAAVPFRCTVPVELAGMSVRWTNANVIFGASLNRMIG